MKREMEAYDKGQQPAPRQIAEYAKRIATDENSDQEVAAFRKDAFSDGCSNVLTEIIIFDQRRVRSIDGA